MIDINFTVTGIEETVLNDMATSLGKTSQQFIIDLTRSYLKASIRGDYVKWAKETTINDLFSKLGNYKDLIIL